MNYHKITQEILDILNKNDLWYETFEHEEVKTSKEAADIREGYKLEQGAKALIIRVKYTKTKKEFLMLVIPANKRFDNRKVKDLLDAKDIRFATAEEIEDKTDGVKIGGVPPFGNLFNMKVIVDPLLFENEKIVFNAGDRRFSLAMKSTDYKDITSPKIKDII